MVINVEITKTGSENSLSVIRRFTKAVRETNVLKHIRAVRYQTRRQSKCARKKIALKRIVGRLEFERLFKLGKVAEKSKKHGFKK
ncbi:MAG: hypothetical protein A2070_09725 [Bdellovibrionales bacterium GWC1_52_8]|nr:MAG: hypothetical protein UW71_C0001G0008 [Parcubacteria group bacterium GW2011_GWB1_44_7]OFZ42686.1 MAG: hypothetical protein A2070_09725 [Bdellovibrionales bacterium GWC1_52_8]